MGIKVIQYTNQFFGQLGGEEEASAELQIRDGAVGPGLAIQKALGDRGTVVATVICGDNTAAENIEALPDLFCDLIEDYKPDMVVAGPAFNAGRFGYACGAICAGVQEKLCIPAITAMYKENPGVDLYRSKIYIIETGDNARHLPQIAEKMVKLGTKLISSEVVGTPVDEGYFSQGYLVNVMAEKSSAERALDMLLDLAHGKEIVPELDLAYFDTVRPAPAIKDMKQTKIGLVTDGGLCPAGNPEGLEWLSATKFLSIDFSNLETLQSGDFYANHGGYDTREVNEDPLRLVPLDIARDLEETGAIKSLNRTIYSTTGVATSVANSQRIGQEIVAKLKADEVAAVILTST